MTISATLLRVTRATASIALAAAVITTVSFPARAHDALIDSTPADGAELTKTTDTIVLTFNNTIAELGGKAVVTQTPSDPAAAGEDIVFEQELVADGKKAVLELPEPLVNGDHTVSWRVVSSDAHPIEGTLAFSVEDPDNVPAVSEPEPTVTAAENESPEATATPETTQTPEATETSTETESEPINWGRLAIFGALGALVGTGIMLYTRRLKKD